MPLRTPGKPLYGTPALFLAALLALSPWVSAQESSGPAVGATSEEQSRGSAASQPQAPRDDYYRAEFVILERIVDPANVNEKMASRVPEPPDLDINEILRAVDRNGTVETTRQLVPRNELHLQTAANRLENSGRFRILLATGWYQSFPPNFDGEPLKVAIGDWLANAGHREVEGHITIDRQRYLHVDVHLNHWQPLSLQQTTVSQSSDEARESLATMATGGDIAGADQAQASSASQPKAELVTWIRETRRMRSEEVHFLDSPTIGVLVFFKKIEE
jgi:hypothetical protein